MAPGLDLTRKIGSRLTCERRVRRSETLSSNPMASRAGGKPSLPVAGQVKQGSGSWHAADFGRRFRSIVSRDPLPLLRVQLPGDPAHLRVLPPSVGIGFELSQEIAGVDCGEARRAGLVTGTVQPMAREAGVLSTRSAAAQRDEFSACRQSVAGPGIDRSAGRKQQSGSTVDPRRRDDHSSKATCAPAARFHRGMVLARSAVLGACLVACKPPPEESQFMPLADAARGKEVIQRVGCASCHTISGIRWPQGQAGPRLQGFDERALIAGRVPNRPDLLAKFVRNAPELVPGTTMPSMPMSEQESRDVAAYLYEIGS